MKTRLWKLREYDKSKNSNYYVSPRRAIFLKEVQNVNGEEGALKRGNIASISINLLLIARFKIES